LDGCLRFASKATLPEDVLAPLRKNKNATAFVESLNKANLYSIAYRLQTAKKAKTRQRRMDMILRCWPEARPFTSCVITRSVSGIREHQFDLVVEVH
jgi:hypothetical protein